MANSDKEAKAANLQISTLQRQVGSLTVRTVNHHRNRAHYAPQDDHPLILVLIDGDGNIFSQDLLALGAVGGGRAAALLTRGINTHMEKELGSRRADIWVTLFLNKHGLSETLASNNMCTPDQFDAFIQGFNQSAPLFSIVDVGYGKEAADSKLKGACATCNNFVHC